MEKIKFPGIFVLFLFIASGLLYADDSADVLRELRVFQSAYPDVEFFMEYDEDLDDWRLYVNSRGRISRLIRADGRYVTEAQWTNREHYRRLIYHHRSNIFDPEQIPPDILERIKRFGSTENRRSGPVSNTAFFDAIYDSQTRDDVLDHIVTVDFLDMSISVHEYIREPLENAEEKIRERALTDPAVAEFIEDVRCGGGYNWRQIADTNGKSFHSIGIAIDLLPSDRRGKIVYWLDEKNRGNDEWYLVPVEDRWMPPLAVVEIFEEEGFIWGGKWALWDTMHFEYRPELIIGRYLIHGE